MRGISSIAKLVILRSRRRAHDVELDVRLHEADDDGAGLQRVDLGERRRLHLEQHASTAPSTSAGVRVELNALEASRRKVAALARAALHSHVDAELEELGGDIGRQGDSCLVGRAFP